MRVRMVCAALGALAAGCASLSDGTDQTIFIPVQPREARCTVSRAGTELGETTGANHMITVSKGARDIIVNCSAPGYYPKGSRLVSTTQTNGMMSVLFLDLGITDMVTGAMWKYPSSTSIVLERDPGFVPSAGAAPATVPANVASSITPIGQPAAVAPQAPATAAPVGVDSVVAERFAREMGCTRDVSAKLIGKGPGYESFSFQCLNGETLVVRCEFGNCRALK
jgi:hypothetical protein